MDFLPNHSRALCSDRYAHCSLSSTCSCDYCQSDVSSFASFFLYKFLPETEQTAALFHAKIAGKETKAVFLDA